MARTGTFEHRPQRKYGENIYMSYSSDPSHVESGRMSVDSWYSEIKNHNFGSDSFNYNTGHFTQVVWRGSKELGTGIARSSQGNIYVVSNYSPAGNVQGAFLKNVPRVCGENCGKFEIALTVSFLMCRKQCQRDTFLKKTAL